MSVNEREAIERALGMIASIALKGITEQCPQCNRKQGYIYFAPEIRAVLQQLVRAVKLRNRH